MEVCSKSVPELVQSRQLVPSSPTKKHSALIAAFILVTPWLMVLYLLSQHDVLDAAHSLLWPKTEVGSLHLLTAQVNVLSKYAALATTPLLHVFQINPPVLTPTSTGCSRKKALMQHVFGNSYGTPYAGQYNPPTECSFNKVTLELTVTSAGRQFDRLGIVYFGDTELWRTSTAEPTADGITWTYVKDMTPFLSLFEKQQKLIFDLGNAITDVYTASYNVTLTATFLNTNDTVDSADRILPISARQGSKNMPSAFQYPQQQAQNSLAIPRNTQKAIFSIAATGQIDEEFWFGNVPENRVDTFGPDMLLGHSPFREVQLYIDGTLAGVVWPFPIIFTGGVVPGLWRPVVDIDTFDLKEDEIDITPWLPTLCDGNLHTFEIRVAGISKGALSNNIGSYWVLTGKVFLWLDRAGSVTTGTSPQISAGSPSVHLQSSITQTKNGTNHTLLFDVRVTRQLNITSHVKTTAGRSFVSWYQDLSYSNQGDFIKFGNVQRTNQVINGLDVSSSAYARQIQYPIQVVTSYATNPKNSNFRIDANITRGQDIQIAGMPTFPTGLQSFVSDYQGSHLSTTQNGSAHYFATGNNKRSSSSGTTQQDETFSGLSLKGKPKYNFPSVTGSSELYERHVLAVNGSLVSDHETTSGQASSSFVEPSTAGQTQDQYAHKDIRSILGHGPWQGERHCGSKEAET